MDPKIQLAMIEWFNAEWIRRTQALENGEANVDWVNKDYRIVFSEFLAHAKEIGYEGHFLDLRMWWATLKRNKDGTYKIPKNLGHKSGNCST